jgi:NTP pyrophosphatase (non-canonical NTP hydrolase)
MDIKEYIENVLKTESQKELKLSVKVSRLDHAAHGLITEAAEFADAMKKHIWYNAKLDEVNLKEELGDIMWYIGIAADTLGLSLTDIMETNILKLKARYTDQQFTDNKANARDLKKERKTLEHTNYVPCRTCGCDTIKVGKTKIKGTNNFWYFCPNCGHSTENTSSWEESLEKWNESNKSDSNV